MWVDADNYDRLMQVFYWAHYCPAKRSFYAKRAVSIGDCKSKPISMPNDVINVLPGEIADHINSRDTLNNCRDNLRSVTQAQNTLNRRLGINNTSGHKNIRKQQNSDKFEVRITFAGIQHTFRNIETIEEAIIVRARELRNLHGEFASDGEPIPTLDELLAKLR